MGSDERGKVRLSMKVVDQSSGQEIKSDDAAA
jgi:polyribonucleotide nucleotidyltransferase